MNGAVQGSVRLGLRLEGLLTLFAATYAYGRGDHSWAVFAALFLVPDVSFVAYLAGARAGAVAYNAAHSYIGPLLLVTLGLMNGTIFPVTLIWAAHLGFDRALGYGLKYPTAFGDTHLGRIGKSQ
jgi:hypothetical protein